MADRVRLETEAMMNSSLMCSPESEAAAGSIRRYEIDDRFTIPSPPGELSVVDVWSPIIPDTPSQRVVRIAVQAPDPWTIGHDTGHGNRILHARSADPVRADLAFHIRYTVERRRVVHVLDPACVRALETPALFIRSLQPEQFVDVNEQTVALARDVVGAETNALHQAQRIYDYVTGRMTYSAEHQSWKGSTEHALACSTGNCNDIHALFISLCRSAGIPARLVMGQVFESPPPGQEGCDLCGYHCWAEFFASGLGWIPVDASCACKFGTSDLFGRLEMNHVAWSVGRDLWLSPPQQGGRLLFFAAPYVEVDGQPSGAVPRGIAVVETDGSRDHGTQPRRES
jgi:transglutaminase-like putative cysteine protease